MRYPPEQIASALSQFYDGLSIDAIRRQLQHDYNIYPSDSTVYEWVVRFTKEAVKEAKLSDVHVGDVWVADETVLKIDTGDVWFWDIIDDRTRFLLASHMSMTRTTKDAQTLMGKALAVASKPPRV
jgi:transposase-like protein